MKFQHIKFNQLPVSSVTGSQPFKRNFDAPDRSSLYKQDVVGEIIHYLNDNSEFFNDWINDKENQLSMLFPRESSTVHFGQVAGTLHKQIIQYLNDNKSKFNDWINEHEKQIRWLSVILN